MHSLVCRLINWIRKQSKPPCEHRWTILLEYYPTFTEDYWQCRRCSKCVAFPNDEPPVKLKREICSLGHLHIVN